MEDRGPRRPASFSVDVEDEEFPPPSLPPSHPAASTQTKPLASSKSFVARARSAVRAALGGGATRFDDWPMEELVHRLEMDGVEIPLDISPKDLFLFADNFYERVPERLNPEDEPVVATHRGVEYVRRPTGGLTRGKSTVRIAATSVNSHQNDGFMSEFGDSEPVSDAYILSDDAVAPHMPTAEDIENYLAAHPESDAVAASTTTSKGLHMTKSMMSMLGVLTPGTGASGVRKHYADSPQTGAVAPEDHDGMEELLDLQGFQELIGQETSAQLKSEFTRPSLRLARGYADMTHPRLPSGQRFRTCRTRTGRHCFGGGIWRLFDPFGEGRYSELARYGVGISLYFKFLKWLFWTFFVMFLIVLPELVINAQGGARRNVSGWLDFTTIGHLADSAFYAFNGTEKLDTVSRTLASYGTDANITFGKAYENEDVRIPLTSCGSDLCAYSRSFVGILYSSLDLAAIFVYLVSLRWLQYFEQVESSRITKHHITVEEYTVQAVRVPEKATEEEIASFFSQLTGEPVADVFLVQDNGALLDLYVRRGHMLNRLWKNAAKVHLLREDHRAGPRAHTIADPAVLEKRIKAAIRSYDHVYAKFAHLTEQRNKLAAGTASISAFITFETQEGFLRCLDLYPTGFWAQRKQPRELRMDPKQPMRVRQAPPPSTIKWENTHYSWNSRRRRRFVTGFFTILVLAASVVSTYFAERERAALAVNLAAKCALTDPASTVTATDSNGRDLRSNLTALSELFRDLELGKPEAALVLKTQDAVAACYCSALSYSESAGALVNPNDPCTDYWRERSPQFLYSFFATLVISAVNLLMQFLIANAARFEKHHSIVNMELSIAGRIFLVLFINTGFILLIVNAQLPTNTIIGSGQYPDFVPAWYGSVGTQIMVTMIINVFAPHIWPMVKYVQFTRRKRVVIAYSQRELNELYLGPVFFMAWRVAQILMTVFVTVMFSSGMPALYPIACCMFLVEYYVDKFFFFHFYRTPPAYSDKLLRWASSWLSWAVLLHLLMAAWMFSAPGIFWDGRDPGVGFARDLGEQLGILRIQTQGDLNVLAGQESFASMFNKRMSLDNVIMIYVALIVFLVYKGAQTVFNAVDAVRRTCCTNVTCGVFDDGSIKRRYLNPNYSEARHSQELRGLHTYNVLENPQYARALGVDAQFARHHRHIASVSRAEAIDLPTL